jgi:uncharacterized protein YukE
LKTYSLEGKFDGLHQDLKGISLTLDSINRDLKQTETSLSSINKELTQTGMTYGKEATSIKERLEELVKALKK